jgi:hypothetical protein
MKPSLQREQRLYDALKRITRYQSPDHLRRTAERKYGLDGDEAIEMAYENVLNEARSAISGLRRPELPQARPLTVEFLVMKPSPAAVAVSHPPRDSGKEMVLLTEKEAMAAYSEPGGESGECSWMDRINSTLRAFAAKNAATAKESP